MSGPWEDFGPSNDSAPAGPWQDFGPPKKVGADAFPDFLKSELANTDWGTRNIAGFGTALSDLYEGAKQFIGRGDKQQIEANRIIEKAAPVGAIAGNVAMTAIPFGAVGNGINDAAKVGVAMGALAPVDSNNTADIVKGKILGAAGGGVLAAAGQGIANKAGEVISNKMADLAEVMQKNAPRTETVNNALDAGLSLTPNSVNPSWWNALKESIGGKAATAQTFSNKNTGVVDDLMRQELHLPDNAPLTPGTLQEARNAAYQVAYKPVMQTPSIKADEGLINDLISTSPASAGGAVKNPAQGQISDLIDSLANKGEWTGQQLVQDIRALREQANANFRAAGMPGGNSGAADLARAQSKASDALENLAQRNITAQGGDPQALELMREARQYIAKSHDIEDALVGGGGTVDARVLARKADKNPDRMTGNLAIVGNAANNFPKSFQPASQVNGPGASALNVVAGTALGGLAGGLNDHPYLGGVAGPVALAMLRGGARAQMLSKMSQNRLRDIYRLGLAPRVTAGALQYAPVAGAVLGREALAQ